MINSEKDLEDYICNHQETFMQKLKEIFDVKYIKFIGRQIRIGNDNIADLVYITKPNDEIPIEELIIVELKFREIFCKDLAQITRYMSTLEEKDNYANFENIYGCFVSFGCSSEMKDVSKYNDKIKFILLKCELGFEEENYCYTNEYLKDTKLDERLTKFMINDSEES